MESGTPLLFFITNIQIMKIDYCPLCSEQHASRCTEFMRIA